MNADLADDLDDLDDSDRPVALSATLYRRTQTSVAAAVDADSGAVDAGIAVDPGTSPGAAEPSGSSPPDRPSSRRGSADERQG